MGNTKYPIKVFQVGRIDGNLVYDKNDPHYCLSVPGDFAKKYDISEPTQADKLREILLKGYDQGDKDNPETWGKSYQLTELEMVVDDAIAEFNSHK